MIRLHLINGLYDADHANRVCSWFTDYGHHCNIFHSSNELQKACQHTRFDAMLFDWNFSGSPGLDSLKWIRQHINLHIPVVFISTRQGEQDIVKALHAGADDYLVKPIRQFELLARVDALVRRSKREPEALDCDPYNFDITNRHVEICGELTKLTEKEYDFALFLFRHRGQVLSREYLLRSVWGSTAELHTRTVDVHASRIRKKLGLSSTNKWKLNAIHRHGYQLECI